MVEIGFRDSKLDFLRSRAL